MRQRTAKNTGTHLPAYGLLAAGVAFLYGGTLGGYWILEELQFVRLAFAYHPLQYFLDRHVWREVSLQSLMPLLGLSYDIDLALFGLEPRWFYLHHLLALWLTAAMLYQVLALWLPRRFAFSGAVLFVASAPVAAVSEMLMVRHYIEGSLLALMALFLFVRGMRTGARSLFICSAMAYFISMSAKEVYVPLVGVLVLLPEGKLSQRISRAIPHFLALGLYFTWRTWMLGTAVGGYGDSLLPAFPDGRQLWSFLIENILMPVRMIAGNTTPGWAVPVLILIPMALAAAKLVFRRSYKLLLFFVTLSAAVYAPLIPLFAMFRPDDFLSYRFVYAASLFYAAATPCALYCITPETREVRSGAAIGAAQSLRFAVVLLLVFTPLAVYRQAARWIVVQRTDFVQPLAAEGRFLAATDVPCVMRKTLVVPAQNYYENVLFFKMLRTGKPMPHVVYDVFAFPDERAPRSLQGALVYAYSRQQRAMSEVTEEFFRQRTIFLDRLRVLPLSVLLETDRGTVSFALGPASGGRYLLLLGYQQGMHCFMNSVPRRLTRRAFTGLKTYIRFGWESPEGHVTLSPEWSLDLSRNQRIAWKQE